MANLITRPNAVDFLNDTDERNYLEELLSQIDVQIDELSIEANSPLIGKTLDRLEISGNGSFIIVALRRQDGITIKNPDRGAIIAEGDRVIVMGHRGDIPQFARNTESKGKMRYRGSSIGH